MFKKQIMELQQQNNSLTTLLWLTALSTCIYFTTAVILGSEMALMFPILAMFLFLFSDQISPQWVMKIHRASELPYYQFQSLYHAVNGLATKAGLDKAPRLFINGGRQPNAFATGSKSNSAICMNEALLHQLEPNELYAVLAHEISHVANGDTQLLYVSSALVEMVRKMAAVMQIFFFISFPIYLLTFQFPPILEMIMVIVAPIVCHFILMALTRTREFDADRSAVKLSGNPRAMINALQKISRPQGLFGIIFGNLQEYTSIWSSHPSPKERIEKLKELELPQVEVIPPRAQSRVRPVDIFDLMETMFNNQRRNWFI
jgi:heat shock protein HtpX